MSASPDVLSFLFQADAALARAGVHPLSDYWRARAEAFYLHPTASMDIEEVGRGGAKTMFAVKCAIAETLIGNFAIPPGECHYFAHVAENVTEANKTLAILVQYLRILGVRFDSAAGAVKLNDAPRGFRVLACRIGAVSGFRCLGWTADESSKWDNDGANPSEEIIASMSAMTVTHPSARGRVVSSPMGKIGYFHERCSDGNTEHQVFGHAPSWIANPGITEAHCRKLANGSERIFRREYLAEAQGAAQAIFDIDAIDRAMAPMPPDVRIIEEFPRVLTLDWSRGGGGDARVWSVSRWVRESIELTEAQAGLAPDGSRWAWSVAPRTRSIWNEHGTDRTIETVRQTLKGDWLPFLGGKGEPLARHMLHVEEIGEVPPELGTEDAVAHVVDIARRVRPLAYEREQIKHVLMDQYDYPGMSATIRRCSGGTLRTHELVWTNASKKFAVDRAERIVNTDAQVRFPSHPTLRKQLPEYTETVTRSGTITWQGSTRHDDFAANFLTLIMGCCAGLVKGDPFKQPNLRHEVR